jgi:hypothetical protein
LPGNWGRLMFSFPLKEERRQSQGIIDHWSLCWSWQRT